MARTLQELREEAIVERVEERPERLLPAHVEIPTREEMEELMDLYHYPVAISAPEWSQYLARFGGL